MPTTLAKLIGSTRPGEDTRLRQATVVAVAAGGTCTIRFGGTDVADNIAGVRMLASAQVVTGGTVWVLQTGGALLVLGALSDHDWHIVREAGHLRIEKTGATFFESGSFRFYSDGSFHCNSIGVGADNPYNNGAYISGGWLRLKGADGIYWEDEQTGFYPDTDGNRTKYLKSYNGGGLILNRDGISWNSAPLVLESSGNVDCGMAFHHPGWRHMILYMYTDLSMRVLNNVGNWGILYADHVDVCTIKAKREVRPLEKGAGLPGVKRLKPTRFKYKVPDGLERARQEAAEGIISDETLAYNEWQVEEERLSFNAEDLIDVIPEAVAYGADGSVGGIRYGPIIAHLVDAVQELADRLTALEPRGGPPA